MDDALWYGIAPAWEHVELVTVYQASRLLTNLEPEATGLDIKQVRDANAMLEVLKQAVLIGTLPPFAAYTRTDEGCLEEATEITSHMYLDDATKVRMKDVAKWCEEKRIPHPWQERIELEEFMASPVQCPIKRGSDYPPELRAAIDAFEAVRDNAKAQAGRSPRAAIAAWLKNNRSELSESARDRIATVANWQPNGGAPKTPGT